MVDRALHHDQYIFGASHQGGTPCGEVEPAAQERLGPLEFRLRGVLSDSGFQDVVAARQYLAIGAAVGDLGRGDGVQYTDLLIVICTKAT